MCSFFYPKYGQGLGAYVVYHNNSIIHLNSFTGLPRVKKGVQMGIVSIWFAGMWCIWKARNTSIFFRIKRED